VITWVLVRGLAREAEHWGPFVPALARALPNHEVLTPDLPGVGARRFERWPGSIARAAEVVRSEVLERARGTRLVLFGVSLGGMVVMDWAARHPEELDGVVVGASSARDVAPFWKRMRPRGIAALSRGILARDPDRRQAHVVRAIINRRDRWEETTRAWSRIERERPVTFATFRGQLASASRWRAPRSLDVPALFLVGRGDNLVHPDCTRALAARFGAPLVEHPDAGHDLTTDAGEWVIEQLLQWHAAMRG